MHEIGIANSILEAVKTEMHSRPKSAPRKVSVRIGELSSVDPQALRFAFDVLKADDDCASLELEIEVCPRRHLCPKCDFEFSVVEFVVACPRCGETSTRCVSGEQLEMAYLELEEHEPSTA
jgi:hydrogenase nickel incorporation protein HypA/HybF